MCENKKDINEVSYNDSGKLKWLILLLPETFSRVNSTFVLIAALNLFTSPRLSFFNYEHTVWIK